MRIMFVTKILSETDKKKEKSKIDKMFQILNRRIIFISSKKKKLSSIADIIRCPRLQIYFLNVSLLEVCNCFVNPNY